MLSTTPLAIGKPVAMPPTRDASLDLLEDRLDSWARWRKGANRITGSGGGSPLAKLQAEGAEVERGGRHVQEAQDARVKLARAQLDKFYEHKRLRDRLPRDHPEWEFHEHEVQRLRDCLGKLNRTVKQAALASMIFGRGHRPEPDHVEEEATQRAVEKLPGHLRDVIEEMYLSPLPAHMKAREMGVSERTLWYRMKQAKVMLARELGL